jgi:predicted lipoprotein with Yx(FWY)xxD motif
MKLKSVLIVGAALATTASLSVTSAASAGTSASVHGTAMRPSKVLTAGLVAIKVTKYGTVLADRSGHTLYELSTEAHGKIHCRVAGGCVAAWPPLQITRGQKVGIGAGIKGKVGTISRSSTTLQVTFNGYPVYTFSGDSGKAQTHGENIEAFGGLWDMLRPSATTASGTPVK